MSQPVVIFDSQQPVNVRLTSDVEAALGLPATTVAVKAVQLQGGWLQVDYQLNATTVRRFCLPPQAVRYAAQDITIAAPPPPPQGG